MARAARCVAAAALLALPREGLTNYAAALWGRVAGTEIDEDAGEEDLQIFAQVYREHHGNLTRLAEWFSVEISLMVRNQPVDGRDFAKKLLAGHYTGWAMQKQMLRDRFHEDLKL